MTNYLTRDIEGFLAEALEVMPVVVITGMRQTGKSTLLTKAQALSDRRYVTLDDFATLQAARENPEVLLAGDPPITIDEAQRCPEVLVAIKQLVDKDRRPGRFLLSGSANLLLLKGMSETLAGRSVYLTLHPFTRREIHGSVQEEPFVLRFLKTPRGKASSPCKPIQSQEVLLGGMPPVCLNPKARHDLWFRGYEQTYLERDLRDLAQIADLLAFRNLLQLAALRTARTLNISELGRDAKLTSVTASRYLDLAETSFVVRRMRPFLINRASRLIKSPKLYFADAGLAAHMAGIHEGRSLTGDPLWGALFETYVGQNLAGLIESHSSGARLYTWSVQGRYEVDFVVQNGRDIMAIEVKAASRWGSQDLTGLRAFLHATPDCKAGVLAYNGTEMVQIGDRIWVIPLGILLS